MVEAIRVLIVPGTTMVAREICDSLYLAKGVSLFGAGYDKNASVDFPYSSYFYVGGLDNEPSEVLEDLTQLVNSQDIDLVFLAHDEWIYQLRNQHGIGKARLVTNGVLAVEIISHKSITYKTLDGIVSTPEVYDAISQITSFPVFAKPNRGQGSKGATLVSSLSDALPYTSNGNDFDKLWVVTEYLPGIEVTVDCFSDADSKVLYSQARLRETITCGVSVATRLIEDQELSDWAGLISTQLGLVGCWFFQVKHHSEKFWVLLEVGGRIAGASGINRLKGINLSLMALYLNSDVSIVVLDQRVDVSVRPDHFDIHFEHKSIYVDFDDTLFVANKLNSSLLSFLKAEKRAGKRIVVITRSLEDVDTLLADAGLAWLGGRTIYVRDERKKSSMIQEVENFLFIDDSFRERLEVKASFGSQVLALDESAFNGQPLEVESHEMNQNLATSTD